MRQSGLRVSRSLGFRAGRLGVLAAAVTLAVLASCGRSTLDPTELEDGAGGSASGGGGQGAGSTGG
ncbi:MAG: hypothetical protein JRH11_19820, partial [Deltaproteobacteria bacterium]|nr:hypothetical protein [Deltaproteobacteria bacterium]